MTYEEALKHIGLNANKFWTTVEDLAALQKAIEALEKQIPRTPIVDIYGDLDCMCPTCYRVFKNLKKGKMSAHCPDCGQALLWKDIE